MKNKKFKQGNKDFEGRNNQHADLVSHVELTTEAEMFHLLQDIKNPLLLILDCVQDPHNLGACLRTANGAGVHFVISPKDRSVGITETVRKIACGGAENTPFVMVTNLARTMEKLKEMNIWLVGTSDRAEQNIYEIDLKGGIGLVLGSEGSGIRRLTSENCDFLAKLPMAGVVECLNVSVATGVCLYEAVRQRSSS